jgi:hypothetical protein
LPITSAGRFWPLGPLDIAPPGDDGYRNIGHKKGDDKRHYVPQDWARQKDAIQSPPEKNIQWKPDGEQQEEAERKVRKGLGCYRFLALGSFRHHRWFFCTRRHCKITAGVTRLSAMSPPISFGHSVTTWQAIKMSNMTVMPNMNGQKTASELNHPSIRHTLESLSDNRSESKTPQSPRKMKL